MNDEAAARYGRALEPALAALEARVRGALQIGNTADLDIVGYGEISTVLAVEIEGVRVVAKRLPPFVDAERVARYRRLFGVYLDELAAAGIDVVPTELCAIARDDGRLAVYCVQPLVAAEAIGPRYLAGCDEPRARAFLGGVVERAVAVSSAQVGFDAQIANWVMEDGSLRYLDVSTPLLRDEQGRERLDTGLFIASLPWALRALVSRFGVSRILATYFRRRTILRDLLANLYKEGLAEWVPLGLELANAHLDEPLSERELVSSYRADARLWATLQWLRRADRCWQRAVRRRSYGFLLPGPIERRT